MVSSATGTKLKIGPEDTPKAVARISNISGPNQSKESIDVTSLDSSSGYREFIDGFKDGGEVSLSGFFDYDDLGQRAVYAAFDTEGVERFVIEFPQRIGAKWTFSGVVTAFETTSEVGNAIGFNATIKVSGKPVLSASGSELGDIQVVG